MHSTGRNVNAGDEEHADLLKLFTQAGKIDVAKEALRFIEQFVLNGGDWRIRARRLYYEEDRNGTFSSRREINRFLHAPMHPVCALRRRHTNRGGAEYVSGQAICNPVAVKGSIERLGPLPGGDEAFRGVRLR